jgi:MotA/TolQ/ExbB proton channel family
MVGFLREGGYPMWVLVAAAVAMLVSMARSLLLLQRPNEAEASSRIDAILFWGGTALIIGVLGTLIGVSQMARVIERMGGVSAPLMWGGLRVALSSTIAGFVAFATGFLVWAALRARLRRMQAA